MTWRGEPIRQLFFLENCFYINILVQNVSRNFSDFFLFAFCKPLKSKFSIIFHRPLLQWKSRLSHFHGFLFEPASSSSMTRIILKNAQWHPKIIHDPLGNWILLNLESIVCSTVITVVLKFHLGKWTVNSPDISVVPLVESHIPSQTLPVFLSSHVLDIHLFLVGLARPDDFDRFWHFCLHSQFLDLSVWLHSRALTFRSFMLWFRRFLPFLFCLARSNDFYRFGIPDSNHAILPFLLSVTFIVFGIFVPTLIFW